MQDFLKLRKKEDSRLHLAFQGILIFLQASMTLGNSNIGYPFLTFRSSIRRPLYQAHSNTFLFNECFPIFWLLAQATGLSTQPLRGSRKFSCFRPT